MGEADRVKIISQRAAELARAMREQLDYLSGHGLYGIDRAHLQKARRSASEKTGRKRKNPAQALREIKEELADCERCGLCKGRTNIVFGDGDPYARVMFVGEAPGADEDAQGIPFVGAAGKLLTDIIEKGMRMKRSEVYITNVVKCRPPDNRDPAREEIEACSPYLIAQVEAIRPKVIVALGKVAAHFLTGAEIPITRLRGQWHEFKGVPVMPTYHPAYLIYNPKSKREVWEDIKKVMERLGIPVEGSGRS